MFERDQIINADRIKSISQQIKSGAQYENPTIELKRDFWDVSTKKGKDEFAKDLTLMANSQYGVGNIIVGIDGESGDLHHTIAPTDFATLANIINRQVLEPFTVEFFDIEVHDKNILVIHIPRSYNKPHILRLHKDREMFIPVRKGTRTMPADKYDLDQMYTEREKIIIPPYRLEIFIINDILKINNESSGPGYSWTAVVNVLNSGTRMNMITGGFLVINHNGKEVKRLEFSEYFEPEASGGWRNLNESHLLKVPQNDVKRVNLRFAIEGRSIYINLSNSIKLFTARIILIDIKGNEYYTDDLQLKGRD